MAAAFGLSGGGGLPGAERLMEQYYGHAKVIALESSWLIERASESVGKRGRRHAGEERRDLGGGFVRVGDKIALANSNVFVGDRAALMRVFDLAHQEGVEMDAKTQALVREQLHLIDDGFRTDPKVNEIFVGMLKRPAGVSGVLGQMNELGVLGRYIPEFGEVVCRVQHDAYHVYTVDVHTLFAIEKFGELGVNAQAPSLLRRLYSGLKEKHLVNLALLLHDIGKGTGKDHDLRGAEMAGTIAARMGLSDEDGYRVRLLVENHLLMSLLAFKRDIHEAKVLSDFAKQIADEKSLKLLYLLTYADINAVAPDLWNDWKAKLLEDLYTDTFALLEKGERTGEGAEERLEKNRSGALRLLEGEAPAREIGGFFEAMGDRFAGSLDSDTIARCYRAYRRLRDDVLRLDVSPEPMGGLTHVIVCTPDVSGLYSMIAGVFAANRVNIVDSEIYTSRDAV
ncbi:MAG: HD domain-containing protein, partial [Vicinamibacteria bacterium]